MSSNFLNRRMDLIHSIDEVSANEDNVLTMDTSYPVKLAGKVIKLFTAVHDYTTKRFILKNSDGVVQLTIASNKVYDFGGRVIEDNIGDNKPYSIPADVYRNGDYVMAIIDFDAESMYICSQSNFAGMVGGGGEGHTKVFNIDGVDEPGIYDTGFDFPFNKSVFDEAAEFNAIEGRTAFTEQDDDEVLYENPNKEYDDSHGGHGTFIRSQIPVAKADVIDLNDGLTAKLNQFIFPYIDNLAGDMGTAYVNKLAAFVQVFGSLSSAFANTFCVSESEMLNSNLLASMSETIKKSVLEEYYNIPEMDRNKYLYVLTCLTETDNFDIDRFDKSFKFIPFDPETGTFPSLFRLNNRGFVVNNESIDIPSASGYGYSDYIGQFEHNDIRQGYKVFHYDCVVEALLAKYNYDNEIADTSQVVSLSNAPKYYLSPDDQVNQTGLRANKPEDVPLSTFSTYLANINSLLNFFVTDFTTATLRDFLDKSMVTFQNCTMSSGKYIHSNKVDNTEHLGNTVVFMYPELFNGVSGNITNYTVTIPGVEDFDRTKLAYAKRESPNDNAAVIGLVYKLFNTKDTSGDVIRNGDWDRTTGGSARISKAALFTYDNDPESEFYSQYIYKSTRSLSTTTALGGNTNDGIFTSDDNKYVYAPICLMSVNKIAPRNGSTLDYNPAEVTSSNIFVIKEIHRAAASAQTNPDEYIAIDAGNKDVMIYKNVNDSLQIFTLYIVTELGSGETAPSDGAIYTIDGTTYVFKHANAADTFTNFKSNNTNWNGNYLYMYYFDNSANLHRVKYHYRNLAGRAVDKYDYYTDNIVFDHNYLCLNMHWNTQADITAKNIDILNSLSNRFCYFRAYLNFKANTTAGMYGRTLEYLKNNTISFNNHSTSLCKEVALVVAAVYGLYTSTSGQSDFMIGYASSFLDISSTCNLAVGVDEIIVYPGECNSKGIYGVIGNRMSNMIKTNNVTYDKNMMTPVKSNKTDINGGYVFNISNYLSLVKGAQPDSFNGLHSGYIETTVNIDGIKYGVYDTGNYLFNFYLQALTSDLDSTNTSVKYFDTVETKNIVLIKKNVKVNDKSSSDYVRLLDARLKPFETADEVAELRCGWLIAYGSDLSDYIFLKAANNSSTDGYTMHFNLDPKNILALGNITLNNASGDDNSNIYVDKSIKSLISSVQTGKRCNYSISLNESNNSIKASINGIDGTNDSIETDDINTNMIINAISNNKSIDVLSYSLNLIKSVLNSEIYNAIQNISDTISMLDNKRTKDTANRTDDPYPNQPGFDPYRLPVGTPWGEYNETVGVYDFNYGYGYVNSDGTITDIYKLYRTLNNRGVIVFTTENGNSYRQSGSGDIYNNYSNRVPDIHPKRMYINNDGLLCTKEYFDREDAEYTDPETEITTYPTPTSLAAIKKSLDELINVVGDLDQRVTAIEQELHPNP